MTTADDQIQSASEVICRNIDLLPDQRALLSQNVLSQLRNLVEGVIVLVHAGSKGALFHYDIVGAGLGFVRSNSKLNFLSKFHKLLQKSASHYTMGGDASERLMLKYYEYLHRIRSLLYERCGIRVLANLEKFPVDLDPSLREYYEKIAERIEAAPLNSNTDSKGRYYIHKIRPFFVGGRIYYEVTFYPAINKVSKFDRIIAFTDIDMTDKYSAMLTLRRDSIHVLGQTMPITIIRDWSISIRPCELDNFARLLGIDLKTNTRSIEYRYLMKWLTVNSANLLDLVGMCNSQYAMLRAAGTADMVKPRLFPVLDKVRHIVEEDSPGQNVLRYLMLRMNNNIIKAQYVRDTCYRLSDLRLSFGCIPFDTMPFCTSLPGHNPRYWDLIESLDVARREHELLARYVKNNVERHGILYTPIGDLEELGDVNSLVSIYNNELYHKHMERRLVIDKGHVFICGYENDTVTIVEKLQEMASSGIAGYTQAVEQWLDETSHGIDDLTKVDALKQLFSQSRVALIYGAAGTGKSTMVNHIANYFNGKAKLFLAHTNPATDNLKRKVTAQNSEFRTINTKLVEDPAQRSTISSSSMNVVPLAMLP